MPRRLQSKFLGSVRSSRYYEFVRYYFLYLFKNFIYLIFHEKFNVCFIYFNAIL